ncbi:DnaB-like helicase N-terminal domain-containing protein [Scytonema sp. UIC 10036]|uniref:DnaB-like helicase N-terminal domain-containing protein n=1 Tax=Scytonema sp. UIC 10036 TaxID=2304196 RepID=UPI00140F8318
MSQFTYISAGIHFEAEEGILGGILLDPEAIERVLEILEPRMFYLQAHGDIYAAANPQWSYLRSLERSFQPG